MKKVLINKVKILWLTLIVIIFSMTCHGILYAASYYVAPNGAATWQQATNINTPCSTVTAMANAVAGDVVNFRGGTYAVPAKTIGNTYSGYYNPSNSGTGNLDSQRIIFKAYPGETPIFNGTAGGSADVPDFATIFGTKGKDYITFDGFTFQSDNGIKMARVIIYADTGTSDYITVRNCKFNGGTTVLASTDNREGLRVEKATNILIQGCVFYNYRQSSNWHNTSGLKFYHDDNITIENCVIYNCSAGIYYKSAVNTAVTRYNYIYNCYQGIETTSWATGYDMPNHSYYHNVISKCSYAGMHIYIEDNGRVDNLNIYNNTIYSPTTSGEVYGIFVGAAGNWTASNSQKFNNNIIVGSVYKTTFCVGPIMECDYNQYGISGSFNIRVNYGGGSRTYSSLTNWKNSTELNGGNHPDPHGLASDPKFLNTSGSYSQLEDFELANDSPSKGSGINGSDMGANISLVGNTVNTSTPPQDTTRPASPTGVNVIIVQ